MKRFLSLLLSAILLCGVAFAEDEEPRARAEALCDALLSGDYAAVAERFDEDMAAMVSEDALRQSSEALLPAMGAHVGRGAVKSAMMDEICAVSIEEKFANGSLIFQFSMDGEGRVAGLGMSPALAAVEESGAWTEVELTVEADPSYPLGATLCLPNGAQKPPVVVLVQGSGSSDRDETIGVNRPFADLAHGLAERGVASLRYDKRSYVYPEIAGQSGTDIDLRGEMLDDVNACIALMRADERVDARRIFVLGHSLGGMMTPAIAAENPDLAGAISMAGSLRPLWEIIYDQNMEVVKTARAAGLNDDQAALLDAQLAQLEADMAVLRGDFSDLPDDQLLLGVSVRYWKSIREYQGTNFLDQIQLPMLILQGDADFQIYPDVDYPLWQKALADWDDAQFRLYPNLNHIMAPTQGKRDVTEYMAAAKMSEEVIEDVARFIAP